MKQIVLKWEPYKSNEIDEYVNVKISPLNVNGIQKIIYMIATDRSCFVPSYTDYKICISQGKDSNWKDNISQEIIGC
jgi:hypothetical protein